MGKRVMGVIVAVASAVLALCMLGCAGSSSEGWRAGMPAPLVTLPPSRSGLNPALNAEQRAQLQRNFSRTLPPQAYVALEKLGMPQGPQGGTPAQLKGTSVTLPFTFEGDRVYSEFDAGYIGSAHTVFSGPPFNTADMLPPGSSFPDSFAYVLYRIDDVVDAATTLTLSFGPTLPGQSIGVAAYNYNYGVLGRWEPLYYGSADSGSIAADLGLVPGADYTNGGDDLAFIAFCLNPSQVSISSVTLDDGSGGPNDPPFADLSASPDWGQVPHSTTLDASGSFDPDGTIASYRFDPLGDGNWIDNGPGSTLDYQYTASGAHHPAVEVTDNMGATATATWTVIVSPGSYSEMENNDLSTEANGLPSIPFGNFYGNIGLGGSYDGDEFDWFTFPASAGDTVSFLLEFAPSADADFEVYLFDGLDELGMSSGYPPQPINYTFDGSEAGPFYLAVRNLSGVPTDYLLTCDDGAYEEVEDNDDGPNANWWALFEVNHVLTDWDGSLGNLGYDGDDDDWYYFSTGSPPWTINLEMTYDNAEVKLGFTLFDTGGVQLASSADGDGHEQISYVVQPGDAQPFYVHCSVMGGAGDYSINGTITP